MAIAVESMLSGNSVHLTGVGADRESIYTPPCGGVHEGARWAHFLGCGEAVFLEHLGYI
jgi:hypothetical protein